MKQQTKEGNEEKNTNMDRNEKMISETVDKTETETSKKLETILSSHIVSSEVRKMSEGVADTDNSIVPLVRVGDSVFTVL